ncbi:EAL domain-containing protein, partial [Desulfobacterota bacterium AH_259_B03_O07]|nr:EAL domain-containing protein [Desulfobacterota bacterium AH_259_B03_O07]
YEENPSMFFTVDADGMVVSVNSYGAKQLGYTKDELIGNSVLDVFHPEDKKKVLNQLKECLRNPERLYQWDLRKIRRDGTVMWVRESARVVKGDVGRNVVLIACEDITNRKRSEGALRKAHQKLEIRVSERTEELTKANEALQSEITERINMERALNENLSKLSKKNRYETIISTVTRSVHQSIDLQEVLENSVEAMSENIDVVEHVAIYLVEDKEAVMKAYRGHPDWFVKRIRRIPYPKGFTWKTIIDGRPIYCADVDKDTVIGPAGKEVGTKSYASMPLLYKGKTVGSINVHSFHKDAFDDEELQLLDIVGKQIGIAIKNAKQAEALQESEERLTYIFDNTPNVAIEGYDISGRVLYWNKAAEKIFGWKREQAIGKTLDQLIFDKESTEEFNSILKKVRETHEPYGPSEWRFINGEGEEGTVYSTIFPIPSSSGNVEFICMDLDITERKNQEAQIHHMAMHDSLTDLPNRRALQETLENLMSQPNFKGTHALVVMDLDNFKLVNDTLGHLEGDQLLIELSEILRETMRLDDLLARVGGDEFAMVIQDVSVDEAKTIAERFNKAIYGYSFYLKGYNFQLGISIGLSMFDTKSDPKLIMAMAYSALAQAKYEGKNRIIVYQHQDVHQVEFERASQWGIRINDAINEDRLLLYFQPIVCLENGKLEYVEALVRMRDGGSQVILPNAFIPAAERFGLMSKVDRWVVEKAISLLADNKDLKLFVNLSGSSLRDESLLMFIEDSVKMKKVISQRLGFEITELTEITNQERVRQWMNHLRGFGCRFALDDFGMGYSSFAHLLLLPVDFVKIEESFIQSLNSDPTSGAIVEAIITVSHVMHKEVIAEGVETESVADFLRKLKVEYGQGNLWRAPTEELPYSN